jgi:hypothetical protein
MYKNRKIEFASHFVCKAENKLLLGRYALFVQLFLLVDDCHVTAEGISKDTSSREVAGSKPIAYSGHSA